MAAKHEKPLAIRQGGHSDLGIVGADIHFEDNPKIKIWNICDTPKHWTKEAVQTFLTSELWTSVTVQHRQNGRQRHNGPTWTFKGCPPPSAEARCFWNYNDIDDDLYITISPFVHKKRHPDAEWISGPQKRWVDNRVAEQPKRQVKRVLSVPSTIPDTPTQLQNSSQNAGAEHNNSDRARSPRRATRKSVQPDELIKQELQNCEIADVGGSGDCVFKACAHSLARHQGKQIEGESLTREAARLRVLAIKEMEQNPVYRATWVSDPKEEAHHRGGLAHPAENFDEYVLQAANQSFYGDGFLIQAMATKLKRDIVVWQWRKDDEFWQRIHLPGGDNKEPLLVALKDEHYRAILLPSGDKCPETWLVPTQKPDRIQLRGAGKSVLSLPDSVLSLDDSQSVLSLESKSRNLASSRKRHKPKHDVGSRQSATSVLNLSCVNSVSGTFERHHSIQPRSTLASNTDRISDLGQPDFGVGLVRKRLHGKQTVQEWHAPPQAAVVTWMCPLCDYETHGSATKVGQFKRSHVQTRHPDVNYKVIISKPKITQVIASSIIPKSQRSWQCPLCDAGLPSLPKRDAHLAVQHHRKTVHPEVDIKTWKSKQVPLWAKGVKKTEGFIHAKRKT